MSIDYVSMIDGILSPKKLTEIKKQIGDKMLKDTQDNFKRQQSPDGVPWRTLRYRDSVNILRKTGSFYASLKTQIDGDIIKTGSDYGILPSGKSIAGVHQYGATIYPKNKPYLVFRIGNKLIRAKKVTIPARPWIGMSQSMIESYVKIAKNVIKG